MKITSLALRLLINENAIRSMLAIIFAYHNNRVSSFSQFCRIELWIFHNCHSHSQLVFGKCMDVRDERCELWMLNIQHNRTHEMKIQPWCKVWSENVFASLQIQNDSASYLNMKVTGDKISGKSILTAQTSPSK